MAPAVNPETVLPEEFADEVGIPPILSPVPGVARAPVPVRFVFTLFKAACWVGLVCVGSAVGDAGVT